MRLRQIALVARELEPVVADLSAVLGLEVSFRDPGVGVFGLENAVMPVGDTFLEVVSPVKPYASAGRFLARRGGDGGYMVILQTDDLAADRARVEGEGARVVFDLALDDMETFHVHPRDVGGAILSFDVARPPEHWRWAGPTWREHTRTERCQGLIGATLQAPDPAALASRWAALLGVKPAIDGTLPLAGGSLRFAAPRDERGPGLHSVAVRASDAAEITASAKARGLRCQGDAIEIGGTWFELWGPDPPATAGARI